MPRHTGFTKKLIEGLPLHEIGWIAVIGDAAATDGAKLALKHVVAHGGLHMNPGRDSAAKFSQVQWEISAAMRREDSKIFREIADYFDAMKRSRRANLKNGWLNCARAPAYQHAANFIWACQHQNRSMSVAEGVRSLKTFMAALARRPFTPKVAEVQACLDEIMGDDAPDLRTTQRICEACGRVPKSRKHRSKGTIKSRLIVLRCERTMR